MGDASIHGGRAGFGAAALLGTAAVLAGAAVVACAPSLPPIGPTGPAATGVAASDGAASTVPTTSPIPSSPAAFDVRRVAGTFPEVTALVSTGERLYWASEASIWQFTPGDKAAERIYENHSRGALVWDLAAAGDGLVFSERLVEPAGAWRVSYVASAAAEPTEVDAGVAEHGAPPTVAIDGQRLAWAGFDEGSGEPMTFLRIAERSETAVRRTLLDVPIDDRLLWYPELDGDRLWYGTIDPDFEASGGGDAISVETIDLADPSAQPQRVAAPGNIFEPVATAEYIAWKAIDDGFSALTWGEIHLRDRRSGEQLVLASRANHASVGARFATYEEFFHQKLFLYDLATRRTIEVPNPLPGRGGTLGVPSVAGNLLAFSTSLRGEKSVSWIVLPD